MIIRGKEFNFKIDSPATMKRFKNGAEEYEKKRAALLENESFKGAVNFNDPAFIMENLDIVSQLVDFCISDIDGVLGKGAAAELLGFSNPEEASIVELQLLDQEIGSVLQAELSAYEKQTHKISVAPVGPKGK